MLSTAPFRIKGLGRADWSLLATESPLVGSSFGGSVLTRSADEPLPAVHAREQPAYDHREEWHTYDDDQQLGHGDVTEGRDPRRWGRSVAQPPDDADVPGERAEHRP
jgi:hypothetical protein